MKFVGHIFFCLFSFSPFSTKLLETSIKIPSRRIDKTLKLDVLEEPTCHFFPDDLRRMSPRDPIVSNGMFMQCTEDLS